MFKLPYTHGKIVNIYIIYEINKNFSISSYATLENCFFREVELTKHPDIDQNKYSGYVTGFDRKEKCPVGKGYGRNCIIFGVDMSSSLHIDN